MTVFGARTLDISISALWGKNNIFIPEAHLGLTWQDSYWKGRQSGSIPLVILLYKDNKAPEGLDT